MAKIRRTEDHKKPQCSIIFRNCKNRGIECGFCDKHYSKYKRPD